jgi:MFS family permease
MSAQRLALSLATLGSILVALDTLVVGSTPLSIRREVIASLEQLEWTVNAHGLALAALRMPRVAVRDRVVSRRWTFVTGPAAFTLTSVGCALVPTMRLLVLAPAVQGVDVAVITPPAIRLHHVIPRHI